MRDELILADERTFVRGFVYLHNIKLALQRLLQEHSDDVNDIGVIELLLEES